MKSSQIKTWFVGTILLGFWTMVLLGCTSVASAKRENIEPSEILLWTLGVAVSLVFIVSIIAVLIFRSIEHKDEIKKPGPKFIH
jgi:hypothetical protein